MNRQSSGEHVASTISAQCSVQSCPHAHKPRTKWKPRGENKIQGDARQIIVVIWKIQTHKELVQEKKRISNQKPQNQLRSMKESWEWKNRMSKGVWGDGRWRDRDRKSRVLARKALGNPAYYVWRNSDEKKAPQYDWGCPVPSVNLAWSSWLGRSYAHALGVFLQRGLSKFRSLPDVLFFWAGSYVTNAVVFLLQGWNIGGWWRSTRCAYHNTSASPNPSTPRLRSSYHEYLSMAD